MSDLNANISCKTTIEEIKLQFTWTIVNVSRYRNNFEKCLRSSEFWSEEIPTMRWYMEFYRNVTFGERARWNNAQEKCFIELHLIEGSSQSYPVDCEISFIEENSGYKKYVGRIHTLCFETPQQFGTKFTLDEMLEFDNDIGIVYDDRLTICCDLQIFRDSISESHSIEDQIVKQPVNPDMKKVFEDRKFCDVVLVVQDKEIPAHKVILSARSPVFEAMFQNEMKETRDGKVEINDVSYECMNELMRFIYTGCVQEDFLTQFSEDLLVAADKYQVLDLRAICEKGLDTSLSVDTASHVLRLADLFGLERMKQSAVSFIGQHLTQVQSTDGWKTLCQEKPHLIIDVLTTKLAQY